MRHSTNKSLVLRIIQLVLILSLACPFIHAEKKETNTIIKIETNYGNMIIELYSDKTPITVKNFLQYINESFYNDTLIHRVVPNKFIQGGGFEKNLSIKKTHPPIKNEATKTLPHLKGSIAMARTSIVDSATSHFFINLADNNEFNHISSSPAGYGYAVFGKVIDGLNIAYKISRVKTKKQGLLKELPIKEVVIKKVIVIE